jgi:hypothetical protein
MSVQVEKAIVRTFHHHAAGACGAAGGQSVMQSDKQSVSGLQVQYCPRVGVGAAGARLVTHCEGVVARDLIAADRDVPRRRLHLDLEPAAASGSNNVTGPISPAQAAWPA